MYSGVLDEQLRKMTDVKSAPLLVNHTFPEKELLPIWIAKEANLLISQVAVTRSNNYRLHVIGCFGACHRPWHYGGKHSLLNVAIH
jgi:hypothetical protein